MLALCPRAAASRPAVSTSLPIDANSAIVRAAPNTGSADNREAIAADARARSGAVSASRAASVLVLSDCLSDETDLMIPPKSGGDS